MDRLKQKYVQCTRKNEDVIETIKFLIEEMQTESVELWLEDNNIDLNKKGDPLYILFDVCKKLGLEAKIRVEY